VTTFPSRIGSFEVIRQIGSGGMGAVYLGRDVELNRQVAIKVIRGEIHEEEALDRFFQEARAAAALRHPNIVTIYASGKYEHLPYIAMEFVEGESLAEIIRNGNNVAILHKLAYLEQLCSGLHFAHRAGIIHRDVKPANVMVDKDGMVRILDFGIARIEGSVMTQGGAMIGSVNYMSPEQMLGTTIDYRSDIFSVGLLAYELLSGQQAFKGGINDGLLQRLPHEQPPALSDLCPDLPIGLEGVVFRALEKVPEDRFRDLAEMRTAIVDLQRRLETPAGENTVVLLREALEASLHDEHFSAPPTPFDSPPSAGPAAGSDIEVSVPEPQAEVAPGVIPAPPVPDVPTWRVKDERSKAVLKRDVATSRPPSARTPPPPSASPSHSRGTSRPPSTVSQSQPASASRKWIVAGSVAAGLIAAAALAIPWLTAAPSDPLELERPGIEAAMERFRIGYQNRDLRAVRVAFPLLPRDSQRSMQQTFNDCLVYAVTFDRMSLELTLSNSAVARADVVSTHTCTPQSGGPEITAKQHGIYALTKNGDAWIIEDVTPVTESDNRQ
jgi:serine/threonine protein kinase